MFLLWLFRKVWNSIALSRGTHREIEDQSNGGLGGLGGSLKRDGFTSRGFFAFSPWIDQRYPKSLLQINMGQSAVRLIDVINLGVLSNFSNSEFYFNVDCDQRYHVEKQPQFLNEVASGSFASVNAALSRFNSPQFQLPPHQKIFKLYCYFLIA